MKLLLRRTLVLLDILLSFYHSEEYPLYKINNSNTVIFAIIKYLIYCFELLSQKGFYKESQMLLGTFGIKE